MRVTRHWRYRYPSQYDINDTGTVFRVDSTTKDACVWVTFDPSPTVRESVDRTYGVDPEDLEVVNHMKYNLPHPDRCDDDCGADAVAGKPIPILHKHTKTACPETGLMCGYWISHFSAEAARWQKEAETLARTVHNQRVELARLYGHKA